jgi:pimeloyl-ACP methyl ester carboxylesterase
LICIVAASAIYNFWAFRHYRALYPPPGKIYPVDGYGMHLYCTGAGSPTIVLESGMGNDWMVWRKVQPELEKLTRVCSYDRAGYGWSETRPGVRDANSIADQLHGLLSAAEISGPVVLMGHSVAGMYLRAYITKYPRGITGLVLVDASTPEQVDQLPAEINALQRKLVARLDWYQPLIALGFARIARQCENQDASMPEAYAHWQTADNHCNPGFVRTYQREAESVSASAAETLRTGPFGELPVLIFSQDPEVLSLGEPEDLQRKAAPVWTSLQEGLKKLSPRARRIVAKGSSHHIQLDRPELVNREV